MRIAMLARCFRSLAIRKWKVGWWIEDMKEITVKVIEKLLEEDLKAKDIAKIMSCTCMREHLENGAIFEIYESVEKYGEENSDNELYEGDSDYYSWGKFLLSVPGSLTMELSSGEVFSIYN